MNEIQDFTPEEMSAALATLIRKQRDAADYAKAITQTPEKVRAYNMLAPQFDGQHFALFIRESQHAIQGVHFRALEGEADAIGCWLLPGVNFVPQSHCDGEFKPNSNLGRMAARFANPTPLEWKHRNPGTLEVIPPPLVTPEHIARAYRSLGPDSLRARIVYTNSAEDLEWLLEHVLPKSGALTDRAKGRLALAGKRQIGGGVAVERASK